MLRRKPLKVSTNINRSIFIYFYSGASLILKSGLLLLLCGERRRIFESQTETGWVLAPSIKKLAVECCVGWRCTCLQRQQKLISINISRESKKWGGCHFSVSLCLLLWNWTRAILLSYAIARTQSGRTRKRAERARHSEIGAHFCFAVQTTHTHAWNI